MRFANSFPRARSLRVLVILFPRLAPLGGSSGEASPKEAMTGGGTPLDKPAHWKLGLLADWML
ncbi:MAG TPA: hypothetical protein VHB79_05630 [Polyangiaceae bacterium]|nr:hypothetical protein [Polyangiaceae bacterium]